MRSVRRPLALALMATLVTGAAACGASIQAVYEGDVRFEHCMALDARADVKPTLRRACWDEWVQFYTFGQTRDRVDYALLRERQLSGASDFDEAELGPVKPSAPAAVPDPTSAFAPPPMMLAADGGAPDAAVVEDEHATARARCDAECQQGLDACRQGCKTAPCEKACSARYKRCSVRCEQRAPHRKP